MHKRKSKETNVSKSKVPKLGANETAQVVIEGNGASDGFLANYQIYLHPAALSKTRRDIFTKGIVKNGGKLVSSASEASGAGVLLLENILIPKQKLETLVDKLRAETNGRNRILALSWLSSSLEQNKRLPFNQFALFDPTIAALKTETTKKSAGTCTTSPTVTTGDVRTTTGDTSTATPGDVRTTTGDNSTATTVSGIGTGSVESGLHLGGGNLRIDRYVCSQSSANPASSNQNKIVTDELEKLAAAYKNSNDNWRALGYSRAIAAIKSHLEPIVSFEQAEKIRGVGRKMAGKVMEIIEYGNLRKVDEVCNNEKMKVIELFTGVWGAGSVTAESWYNQGYRNLEDLKGAKLSKQQVVGLRLYSDLIQRMPRTEAGEIRDFVDQASREIKDGLEVTACGSYRRGKETCGDIDLLVTHPDGESHVGVFDALLQKLHSLSFLTDDLTIQRDGNQQKYLGVCRLPGPNRIHRRVDIIVVPWEERACALLYFTGSAHFNRSMRQLAGRLGMHLSEHSLRNGVIRNGKERVCQGHPLDTPTEESVFQHLGLEYRPPQERDH